jgi:hypothetical protein
MKNRLFILTLSLLIVSCKAQVIGTLEQFEECSMRPNRDQEGCPDLENVTYVKDTNNRLNQFVGTWKGNYSGKLYEIKLDKKTNYKYFSTSATSWDRIIGRMLVKDSSGNTIYNSMNETDKNVSFFGDNFQKRSYVLSFVANAYCNDSGDIFIEISKNNPNIMYLHFSRDQTAYNPAKCPNFTTYTTVLPMDKITLIKQ